MLICYYVGKLALEEVFGGQNPPWNAVGTVLALLHCHPWNYGGLALCVLLNEGNSHRNNDKAEINLLKQPLYFSGAS